MTSNTKAKTIYNIMPDFGGAYGWIIRDGDESHGVGGNHACQCGWVDTVLKVKKYEHNFPDKIDVF